MSTEADKTNTAVVGTMLAIGTAAMIGGSAALVALARGEVQEYGEATEAFADLNTVKELKAQQEKRLQSAKLSITKAQAVVLTEIQRDPSAASPAAAAAVEADAGAPQGDAGVPPAEAAEGESEEGVVPSQESVPAPEGAEPVSTGTSSPETNATAGVDAPGKAPAPKGPVAPQPKPGTPGE